MCIHFWKRETEHKRDGVEREGDTESEAGSMRQAVSTEPDVGLEPMNRGIMTQVEVRHSTDWATQVPHIFLKGYLFILRLRERVQAGKARERGGDRIPSRLYTAGAEPNVGLEPTNHEIVTSAEIKSDA